MTAPSPEQVAEEKKAREEMWRKELALKVVPWGCSDDPFFNAPASLHAADYITALEARAEAAEAREREAVARAERAAEEMRERCAKVVESYIPDNGPVLHWFGTQMAREIRSLARED